MSTMDRAIAAWGEPLPDWIKALAEACDATSLRKTALKLDASPAIVSLAIGNKRQKLDFIKGKVESVLMIIMVACPVLGDVDRNECLREQAAGFSAANPLRVQLYRACRNGCPHFNSNRKEKPC